MVTKTIRMRSVAIVPAFYSAHVKESPSERDFSANALGKERPSVCSKGYAFAKTF
jgi:hypothetical protein